jgi:hypothetical protein
LAQALLWSPAKLSRIETGGVTMSTGDLRVSASGKYSDPDALIELFGPIRAENPQQ